MTIRSTKEPWLLALGDVAVMFLALFLALTLRNLTIPDALMWQNHLLPFSIIWLVSIFAYYIAGAYERYSAISVRSFMARSIQAIWVIAGLAISLFYFIPFFGVTPKTTLFIYLGLFTAFHIGWRVVVSSLLSRHKTPVLLIADGTDADLFVKELSVNQNIPLSVNKYIKPNIPEAELHEQLAEIRRQSGVIIVDTHHGDVKNILPRVYDCLIDGCTVLDFASVYGDIFNRLPLSSLSYAWLFENITVKPKPIYDVFKRVFDVLISIVGSIIPLVLLPFIVIAIKIQDGGPVFFFQERVGKNGNTIRIRKFRSWDKSGTKGITPLGKFLRNTRVDELPQFWDVILGKISLIGPRPETVPLVRHYSLHVPYYDVRHTVSPGLSGWAQVYHENHPHHEADIDETKVKVSYDLYYIMNRSFMLDITIAVKTIRTLLSRSGR